MVTKAKSSAVVAVFIFILSLYSCDGFYGHINYDIPATGTYGFTDVTSTTATFFFSPDKLETISVSISPGVRLLSGPLDQGIIITVDELMANQAYYREQGYVSSIDEIVGGYEYFGTTAGNALITTRYEPPVAERKQVLSGLEPNTYYFVEVLTDLAPGVWGRPLNLIVKTKE